MNDLDALDEVEQELVEKCAQGEIIKDASQKLAFKMLFSRAKLLAVAARNALVIVDSEDPKKIRALQNDVLRYEEMADWIRTAIVQGKQAFEQLEAYRGGRSAGDAPEEDT